MNTLKSFTEYSNISSSLIRAVVRQCGGWESFKEIARDAANHGADSGFSGFIYYNETVPFFRKNRKDIRALAVEQAEEYGMEGPLAMIRGFRCIGQDYTTEEIAQFLYGRPEWEGDSTIPNCLAWYALEEVSRSYVDMIESLDH